MNPEQIAIKQEIRAQLIKSRKHLEYSFQKIMHWKLEGEGELSEAKLEVLESFSSRFARYSELLIAKYFRFLVIEKDPGFRGSVIDLLNQAEKHGWISSAVVWRRIRELRNIAAHEYTLSEYQKLYQELIQLTPHLLHVSLEH